MRTLIVSLMGFSSLVSVVAADVAVRSSDVSPFHYTLEPIISEEHIAGRIQEFSRQLQKDYEGQEICVLAVLKGSLWFVTDLMRAIQQPAVLRTISCSSYGERGTTAGQLVISGLEKLDIKDKHVLVIDDICDTGATLSKLTEQLKSLHPKSLKTAVLLLKENRRSIGYTPDYHLFEIEDLFVVGYGLDYKEYYRGLRSIYVLGYSEESQGES